MERMVVNGERIVLNKINVNVYLIVRMRVNVFEIKQQGNGIWINVNSIKRNANLSMKEASDKRRLCTFLFLEEEIFLADLTCSTISCSHGAQCAIDKNGNPGCSCPTNCDEYLPATSSSSNEPICASDHQNYSNECQMKKVACQLKINLTKLYDGMCSIEEQQRFNEGWLWILREKNNGQSWF